MMGDERFDSRCEEMPFGGHMVEHWHDGVMVEKTFIMPFEKWRFWRDAGEHAARKGDAVCWISAFMKSRDAFEKQGKKR